MDFRRHTMLGFNRDIKNNYLTIVACEDGLSVELSDAGSSTNRDKPLYYCINGSGDWEEISLNDYTRTINCGEYISFKAELIPDSTYGIGTFYIDKKCTLTGNCNSLLFGDNVGNFSLVGYDYAFKYLFLECDTITSVSSNFLPATTLSEGCYESMFSDCTTLVNAPELPATSLTYGCYSGMFSDCTTLVNAPELPATTLSKNCYSGMFSGCTSLVNAPVLLSTELESGCYDKMFYNCIKLSYIKAMFTTTPSNTYTEDWVLGVASRGTFEKNIYATWDVYGSNGIPSGWRFEYNIDDIVDSNYQKYLTIVPVADGDGLTAKLLNENDYREGSLYYCINGNGEWVELNYGEDTPVINVGDCISFKGNLTIYDIYGVGTFEISKKCVLTGNCNSLLFGDNADDNLSLEGKDYAFATLFDCFYGSNKIVSVSSNFLPATTLSEGCYSNMFYDCTSLVNAPELPATTLSEGCYESMFSGCTSLVNAPELPATDLVSGCYREMFYKCNKLNYIKVLFTYATNYDLNDWLYGVASDGVFVKNVYADWFRNLMNIPNNWVIRYNTDDIVDSNYQKYLTIVPVENVSGLTVKLKSADNYVHKESLYYCINGNDEWVELNYGENTPAINVGDYISFKMAWRQHVVSSGIGTFEISKKCALTGNCNSLLHYDSADDELKVYYTYVFKELFKDCTNILSISSNFLPATTLTEGCYRNMFSGCTGLSETLILPSNILTNNCYKGMFSGCINLKFAPLLLSTVLSEGCYSNMFSGCTSLVNAPALPSKNLKVNCYSGMFSGCIKLVNAPALPATKLENGCYNEMFYNCTKISYIKAMFITTPSNTYTKDWVLGVASHGVFEKNIYADWDVTGYNGVPSGWNISYDINETNSFYQKYLTIASFDEFVNIKFTNTVEYYNSGRWVILSANTTLSIGLYESVRFRRAKENNSLTPNSTNGIGTFTINGKCILTGNCNSLLFGDNADANLSLEGYNYAYRNLFKNCTDIVSVSSNFLPATTLSEGCYSNMFPGCTSLVNAPELPATRLSDYCYAGMFSGCTSLVNTYRLPALTLSTYCYYGMFYNCKSLVNAPAFPTEWLGTLGNYCCSYMFSGCTSLVKAPELNFITLENKCYENMFNGCTNLNYIKALFRTKPGSDYTDDWVKDVAKSGTFVKSSLATWNVTGNDGVPSGWTVEKI